MAETTKLELPDDEIWIESLSHARAWLDAEFDNWVWLGNAPNLGNTWNNISAALADLRQVIDNARQYGQPVHQVTGQISHRFTFGPLIYSGSAAGRRILEIREQTSPEAAGAAYGFYRAQISLGEIRSFVGLQGLMEFGFPSLGPVNDQLRRVAAERTTLRRTVKDLETKAASAASSRTAVERQLFRRGARKFLELLSDGRGEAKGLWQEQTDAFSKWEQSFKGAVDDMAATKAAYVAQMELQAPVDYWNTKAEKHKKARIWMLGATIVYFLITMIGLGTLFFQAGFYLIHHKLENNSALFVAGAGLATLSGVLLWAGRLITRLYLSEHHLAHDAEERAVMTKTYLALTAQKAATDAERAIILAALFRNTSDGVVKDDAALDLSAGGLIARLVSK